MQAPVYFCIMLSQSENVSLWQATFTPGPGHACPTRPPPSPTGNPHRCHPAQGRL